MVETTDNHESEEPFHPSLTRKLIQSSLVSSTTDENNGPPPAAKSKRMTNEAVVAASEVLRLFVQEARHRAGILAECEHEGRMDAEEEEDDDDDDGKTGNNDASKKGPVVGADHIARVAAELLMDFS